MSFTRYKLFWFSLVVVLSINSSAQVVINEVFVTNCSHDLHTGEYNYINWIELYNTSESSKSIAGYYLSDDSLNFKKWKLPSINMGKGAFLTIYADGENTGYHTNFKPDADGDTLYLVNSSGIITERFVFGKQIFNVSYGRQPDGSANFYYFLTPTRSKPNISNVSTKNSGVVLFRKIGGFYKTAFNLELQTNAVNGHIYYTTDCSEPSESSNLYTVPINISKTTVIRARVYSEGYIPSTVYTQTYFINQRMPKMPVMSLTTTPKNLWDNTIGIYVKGTNGIEGNCTDRANWNRDWERCANFEFFDEAQTQVINQLVGTKIGGACSRSFTDQKPLIVTAKNKYGKKRLQYFFFKNRGCTDYNSVYLRNSGNDWNNTMYRDAMIQYITDKNMDLEHQEYQPAVLFLNGQYYGIQNLYERSGTDLIEDVFGYKEEDIDLLDKNSEIVTGSATDYQSLVSFLNSNSLANETAYKYVESQIDINNYIDYLIIEIYCGNHDWPGNNIKYWRKKNPETKWRWILFDTDFGFGLSGDANQKTLEMATTITDEWTWPNPTWGTLLFRSLLQNPEFKRKFINRFYAHINSTFASERVISIIDSIQNLISSEIPYHFRRWNVDPNNWPNYVETMRNYARQRPAAMMDQLENMFLLNPKYVITCQSTSIGHGFLTIDNTKTLDTAYIGYFPGGMVANYNFIPLPGFSFVKAIRNFNNSYMFDLIKSGDEWKYYDQGPGIAPDWNTINFDDSLWPSGKSQLGYQENDENTVISYGPDANNKYISSYFRKTVHLDSDKVYNNLKINILYDDGAVVYINGTEAFRVNMNDGAVSYETLALPASVENTFFEFPLDQRLLKAGDNVIAVEVHQSSVTSSDVSFDLKMAVKVIGNESSDTIYSQSFTDTLNSNTNFYVTYKPTTPISGLVLNEIAPSNKEYLDESGHADDWFEVYNNGTDTIDISNVFFTDSLQNPTKFKMKTSNATLLYPNEYKVIWADNEVKQGPLHVNFKLNSKGEEIGIYQIVGLDTLAIDNYDYSELSSYKTFARFPDIIGDFKILNRGTPGTENKDLPPYTNNILIASKDIVSIFYNLKYRNLIIYNTEQNKQCDIQLVICDISGRFIFSENFKLIGSKEINLNDQKPGIYIARIVTGNTTISKKLLVQ